MSTAEITPDLQPYYDALASLGWEEAEKLLTPRMSKYCPHQPTDTQTVFLLATDHLEAFYGGSAGGGKSDALLMAALQYVDTPGYSAILFRRSYADLSLPGALMDRAGDWLGGTDAKWLGTTKTWSFPSGATLSFGYLEHEQDKWRYQGAEFCFVGFDELTQFTESQYRYLFSRLRRKEGSAVPLRMRAASNPGGIGHEWVKRRFIKEGHKNNRPFIPAKLADNPYLDQDQYITSLNQLDPITRAQLLAGDWDAVEGGRFKRHWFRRWSEDEANFYLHKPDGTKKPIAKSTCWRFCTIDPAASEKETADYTAIGTFAVSPDRDLMLLDMIRERLDLDRIAPTLATVCDRFKPSFVAIEGTGFQVAIVNAARRHPSIPAVRAITPQGKGKLVRATPAIIRCEAGQFYLPVSEPWLEDYESELVQFTGDEKLDSHDDQVDVTAYAVQQIDSGSFGAFATFSVDRRQMEPQRSLQTAQERRGLFGR